MIVRTLLCLDDAQAAELRGALPSEDDLDRSARVGAGLSDTTRLRVACVLALAGELCVRDTATLLELPIQLVSHHVRILARCQLAASRRDGKLTRYHLTPEGRQLLAAVTGRAYPATASPLP
jgi:DNA-binding transcriptional ArsR family regulator